jgi:superfamily II DNA or RNA helicase
MSVWQRASLEPGIYDEIITARLDSQLRSLGPAFDVVRRQLSRSETIETELTAMLREAIELALAEVKANAEQGLRLAEATLEVLQLHAPRTFSRPEELRLLRERLRAINVRPAVEPERPRSSLHASGLIVNAEGESLLDHLRSEFDSADQVDLLCAFVKLSGFEKFRTVIEQHCRSRGRVLRVLTTTYMGATDAKAIERLAALPNVQVKISFDEHSTRLHAKAWVFHRRSGFSTAYVGSSNLSHAAQTDGLEWNVRVTESDQPALLAQMQETFDQYWEDGYQFETFDHRDESQRERLRRALSPTRNGDSDDSVLLELTEKDFQKPILDELAEARRMDRHRNLLVAATGTGKTVMAAIDYRRLCEAGAVDTLLFVAHRREILEQSRRIFRSALQSHTFGELLYEGVRPTVARHVFASIDSLGDNSPIDPGSFDLVILDEAHHSAAEKWDRLLARIRPRELLGLTGTPERADGLDYQRYFPRPWIGNLRVWNAIPHALVPFRYYILDVEGVDLRDVAWTAGRYAPEALAGRLIGAAEAFVQRAVNAVAEYIARTEDLRAIAFCSNIRHAEEVKIRLAQHGFRAAVLTGTTSSEIRRNARHELDAGRIQILCVVDIYNEGIDVPNVNTLFFFRPTESATVFLQQFGRGLRRAPAKSELVVFDLSGRQSLQFRFDRRLRALLGHTPREVRELVTNGFGKLPAGCHIRFDEVVQRDVLSQLRHAIPDDIAGIQALLREPAHADHSLAEFLRETDVELEDIYRRNRCWTLLRRGAGLEDLFLTDGEENALCNIHKLIHVGDEQRLAFWEKLIGLEAPATERERRLQQMLFAVLYGKEIASTDAGAVTWSRHSAVRAEMAQLIPVLRRRNAILAEAHSLDPDIPLALHGRYLSVELSAAFGERTRDGRLRDYYTGVETTRDGRFDLLLVTLEKSAATKEHLRYRDFPLNAQRFHWQSKARTTRDSRQGRRHLEPLAEGCSPLLFVRERADDRPGVTMAFRYLGPVLPDGDQGERPITIEWKLHYAMPADLVQHGRVAA